MNKLKLKIQSKYGEILLFVMLWCASKIVSKIEFKTEGKNQEKVKWIKLIT